MPTYEALCKKCDIAFDYSSEMKFRDVVPYCPSCAGKAKRVILTAPTVHGDLNTFEKPQWNAQLGCNVTSVADAEEKGRKRGWGMTRG